MKTVHVTHHYQASPERVFNAWLDPSQAGRFLFATDTGQMTRVEIDPHVGGRYVIVERRDGEEVLHEGEYVEIDRPRRLVFTLRVPAHSRMQDRIFVDIAPAGDGCDLTLETEFVPETAEFRERVEKGWQKITTRLERLVHSTS
jgi:uncharacterized protein YndB with AHSA1/START domain